MTAPPRHGLPDLIAAMEALLHSEQPLGRWVIENADGGLALPWVRYDHSVQDLIGRVADVRARIPEPASPDVKALFSGAADLSDANLPALLDLILHADRGERFCDGCLLSFLEQRLGDLVQRLREVAGEG